MGILVLFSILGGNAFCFSPLTIMLAVGLSYYGLYYVEVHSFYSHLAEVFIMNRCWILLNAFSAFTEMIIWFVTLVLLIWCIILIYLWVSSHLCIPGIKFTWSWKMFLSKYCLIYLLILCWGFLQLCSSGILACNFFFLCCFCLVLASGESWSYMISLVAFLYLLFFLA